MVGTISGKGERKLNKTLSLGYPDKLSNALKCIFFNNVLKMINDFLASTHM